MRDRILELGGPPRPAAATIQLHGGIGFTWEHDTRLYHKNGSRRTCLSGDPKARLGRLRALLASEECLSLRAEQAGEELLDRLPLFRDRDP